MIPDLLAEAVEAHGGLEHWRRAQRLTLRVRIGGNLLLTKLRSPGARSLQCSIEPGRVYIELKPFPRSGFIGVLDEGIVRIQSEGGEVVVERTFGVDQAGMQNHKLVWDDLDELYFLAYALWNYATAPFLLLLPGFELHDGAPWREADGSVWRTLHARFPIGIPTHGRHQTFYFDQRGLLRRLDYTADVFGSFARAAHYCHDHRKMSGLVIPTHRVVYPRLRSGQPFRLLKAMEGWVDDVRVEERGASSR